MHTATSSAPDRAPKSESAEGLTSEEAAYRLSQYGPNELTAQKRTSILGLALQFLNPLSLILLIAAAISASIGERLDAGLISGLVLIGSGIDFYQSHKSNNAVQALRHSVASTATVLRDGQWGELDRTVLVPGDLIRLAAGDLVPADAVLISTNSVYIQQSALTGESAPVSKEAASAIASTSADAENMVFLGTSVVSGTAEARIVATGPRTGFGDIASKLTKRPPGTAFDIGLKQFGYLITRVVFFLVLFVLLVSLAFHRGGFESLLFAVALAVGLTPEFLPMITSVTLSKGAIAMAHKSVIVKHLSAIQNLGSIDILCSDKTGTLTAGSMTLHSTILSDGASSPRPLELASINSRLQTGVHSPLDTAILSTSAPSASLATKVDEIPYDFERRRLSIVAEVSGTRLLICKGAPEGILPLLTGVESGVGAISPLDDAQRSAIISLNTDLSRQGLRVIAVAYKQMPVQETVAVSDEQALIFAGYLSFSDPLLADTAEMVTQLRKDGVHIKVLTGDSDLVAAHVCGEAGISKGKVVTGDEIDGMTDGALGHVAERASIFARLSPAQKLRILNALRTRGHVIGYIGDGVNDAPTLHAADVGIAAPTAVDIAREAADVILLKPGLSVIHEGIQEGRKAFGNVMKYLLMGTSSNFGNVLSMAVASVAIPFLPMLPTQVLLNNFLYDLSQLTIPTDNVDAEYLQQPQRWDMRTIRRFMLVAGPISSLYDFVTFYVLLHFFHAKEAEFHTGWFVESLATQTLVLLVIRTMRSPFKSVPSSGLLTTVLCSFAIGLLLPYSPFAADLGFVALPAQYFLFLGAALITYLCLMETAKRWLLPKQGAHFRQLHPTTTL